ncbi:hypothetical protein GCM10028821_33680 [Hymenobacter jeollabukensis]
MTRTQGFSSGNFAFRQGKKESAEIVFDAGLIGGFDFDKHHRRQGRPHRFRIVKIQRYRAGQLNGVEAAGFDKYAGVTERCQQNMQLFALWARPPLRHGIQGPKLAGGTVLVCQPGQMLALGFDKVKWIHRKIGLGRNTAAT